MTHLTLNSVEAKAQLYQGKNNAYKHAVLAQSGWTQDGNITGIAGYGYNNNGYLTRYAADSDGQ